MSAVLAEANKERVDGHFVDGYESGGKEVCEHTYRYNNQRGKLKREVLVEVVHGCNS